MDVEEEERNGTGLCSPVSKMADGSTEQTHPPSFEEAGSWLDQIVQKGVRDAVVTVTKEGSRREEKVYLMRARSPERAYQRVEGKRGDVGGTSKVAVALERDNGCDAKHENSIVFHAPVEGRERLVTIRKAKRALASFDAEWNALVAMHLYGDNRHIVRYHEVLSDDHSLYVIMPHFDGGDLCDRIPWGQGGMNERDARGYFIQILDHLNHLRQNRICHRDISPENIVFANRDSDHCALILSGSCRRIPYNADGPLQLSKGQKPCGKPPYMAPELFGDFYAAFDGQAVDLWSATTVLYAMLTGLTLYQIPHSSDIAYRLFVHLGGIANEAVAQELLYYMGRQNDRPVHLMQDLAACVNAHQKLSSEVKDLLHGVLRPEPGDRLTLDSVLKHPWLLHGGSTCITSKHQDNTHASVNGPAPLTAVKYSYVDRFSSMKRERSPFGSTGYWSFVPDEEEEEDDDDDNDGQKIAVEAQFSELRVSLTKEGNKDAEKDPCIKKDGVWKPTKLRTIPADAPFVKTSRLVCNTDLSELTARLMKCIEGMGISADYDNSLATAHLSTADEVKMHLSLWNKDGAILVRLERLVGCSVSFHGYSSSILAAAEGKLDPSRILARMEDGNEDFSVFLY